MLDLDLGAGLNVVVDVGLPLRDSKIGEESQWNKKEQ